MLVVELIHVGECNDNVRQKMEMCGVAVRQAESPGPTGAVAIAAPSGEEVAEQVRRSGLSPDRLVAICPDASGLPSGCLWLDLMSMDTARVNSLMKAWISGSEDDPVQGLLAQISHDMRAPLSVITTAASLIAKFGIDQTKSTRYLALINESSGVLKSLVNDILDYSNIRQGEFSFSAADFHLPQLLSSITDSFRLLVKESQNLTVSCQVTPSVPVFVHGDPGRLRQVLTNLMNNALKFTESGSITLCADVREGALYFQVQDTGIGIASDALERIFLPYQQADRTVHATFGGTGLGLTICRALVDRMGGRIGVASEVGKGSQFWFTARLPEVVTKPVTTLPELAGRRVLVSSGGATLAVGWLTQKDEVKVASTRDQALELLAAGAFDIHLVDLDLGQWEFVRELVSRAGSAPVVVATSVGQRGDVALCKEIGVAGYLTAPLDQHETETALALALNTSRQDIVTKYSAKEFLAAQRGR